jgi:hypothetical protein
MTPSPNLPTLFLSLRASAIPLILLSHSILSLLLRILLFSFYPPPLILFTDSSLSLLLLLTLFLFSSYPFHWLSSITPSLNSLLVFSSYPLEQHGVGQPKPKQIQVKHTGKSVRDVIAVLSIFFTHTHSFVFPTFPLFAHFLLSSLTLSFHFSLSFVLLRGYWNGLMLPLLSLYYPLLSHPTLSHLLLCNIILFYPMIWRYRVARRAVRAHPAPPPTTEPPAHNQVRTVHTVQYSTYSTVRTVQCVQYMCWTSREYYLWHLVVTISIIFYLRFTSCSELSH